MKIFGYEINLGTMGKEKNHSRNYTAAKTDRLTSDWLTSNLVADETLRWALPKLRERSRDLARNNDYMKNFLRKLKINTIGPNGFAMQSKVRLKNGELDKSSNQKIEEAWQKWSKKENTSVCGTLSLKDFSNIAIETVARDGEVLIRKIKGYDNKYRFALQLMEADHLDHTYNVALQNGNIIKLGIEKNTWGKPVAYHLWEKHPGDVSQNLQRQRRLRIPAEEITHLYIKERPSQSRGVPWAHTAIIKLRMVGAYEEAAVINARVGASKMQSIIMGENISEYEGDSKDSYGNVVNEIEPGMREVLPPGTQIHDTDFSYPSAEFGIFNKAMLRGIASGIGCSYNSLANDLEGVNFSSLRSGLLEERDGWMSIQTWFLENYNEEIYPDWVEMAILSNQLKISYTGLEKFIIPKWQGRRWAWVDPEKDINARITELKAGLTTRQRICSEKGEDFEEILEELKEEQKMIDEAGLNFNLENSSTEKPKEKEDEEKPLNEGGEISGKYKSWKTVQGIHCSKK